MKKRKFKPRLCACRCGQLTREGFFIDGHDALLYTAILNEVGGLVALRDLVEGRLGRQIKVETVKKPLLKDENRDVLEKH